MSKVILFALFFMVLLSCHTDNSNLVEESGDDFHQEEEQDRTLVEPDGEGRKELSWLDKAEKAWFDQRDRELTDYCLDRVDKSLLVKEDERSLYQLLCRKVYTNQLPLDQLGFPDRNISSLFLDRDDLWLGTWTGGIARYSLPLEELTVLRKSRESLRVEKISDFESQNGNIRLAGYSDLYIYEKSSSRFEQIFPENMDRINNLAWFRGRLYASTVNSGLWYEAVSGEWVSLGEDIPGLKRINTLYVDGRGRLLIGTVTEGIFSYDGSRFVNLAKDFPQFDGRNITSLAEKDGLILVGTYGEGSYILKESSGSVVHYSKEKGDFASDYFLCVLAGERWLYGGTLGGGLYALDREAWQDGAEWISLGMDEGLSSLDTAALVLYGESLYISLLGQGILIMNEDIIEKAL
ncbi:MAG: hypothetical protein PQJ60_00750 [Spirochaetales bacterium]|nr:hypothetical protein [Spirochaetales bacterium]